VAGYLPWILPRSTPINSVPIYADNPKTSAFDVYDSVNVYDSEERPQIARLLVRVESLPVAPVPEAYPVLIRDTAEADDEVGRMRPVRVMMLIRESQNLISSVGCQGQREAEVVGKAEG